MSSKSNRAICSRSSLNAPEMLDLAPHAVPSMEQREALTIGMDVQSLFQSQSAVALQKAASFREVNLLNPILVHCRSSVMAAGAPKSYKLAAKAIFEVAVLAQREHLPPVV
ncbi:hypothetical protein OPV22_004474 [Ensete ventricosum]|uniref:PAS fold-2 domain-containing protein n=1 Tax=Ensete ventricosum TaxID=4639 RepID=A0AAV8S3V0_ENSVE|nr:hypothetical protein OPV22_004474 [Ensete ventricosum]